MGRIGSALALDSINDQSDIADSSSLVLTNSKALEAWVYPAALSGWRTVILVVVPGAIRDLVRQPMADVLKTR